MHFVFNGNLLFWSHHQENPLVLNQKSFWPHYYCCTLVVLSYSSHFLTKGSRKLLIIPIFSCIRTRALYLSCFLSFFLKPASFDFNRKLTLCFSYISSPFLSTNLAHCLIYLSFRSKPLQDNGESTLVTLCQVLVVMFNYFCSKMYTTGNTTETPDLKIWHFYQGENIMNEK